MKIKLLLAAVLLLVTVQLNAQERSAYRAGYLRLGVNILGDPLLNALSPKENIFEGRYGASGGYVFEFGRIFYFGKKNSKSFAKLGLDWTFLSLNYNKMDKWDEYGQKSGAKTLSITGQKIAASGSTKLGPVLSLNLFEKVVVDARFQIAPTVRYFDFAYSENQGLTNQRYFNFINYSGENEVDGFEAKSLKNRLAFGVARSAGLTLRRKGLGISADYIKGNVKSTYDAYDHSQRSNGKEKIKSKTLQFTLNFTF